MTDLENKVNETLEAWSHLDDFDELVTIVVDLISNETEQK